MVRRTSDHEIDAATAQKDRFSAENYFFSFSGRVAKSSSF